MAVVKATYDGYIDLQDKLGRYTSDIAGKDRLFRLGIYVCRFILALIEDNKNADHIKKPLTNLEKSLGHVRRVIRLGKVFSLMHTILVLIPQKYGNNPVMYALDVLRNGALVVYNLNDHMCWLSSQHIFEFDMTSYAWRAAVGWFTSLIVQMIQDAIRLKMVVEKMRGLRRDLAKLKREEIELQRQGGDQQRGDTDSISSHQRIQRTEQLLEKLRGDRNVLYINFIKNFADFPLALTGSMQWKGPNAPIPPWVLGLCGTFSSSIAVYTAWGQKPGATAVV